MAFKIEFLKTKEELNELGVENYQSKLTKRSVFKGKENKSLWDEFGANHFLHINKEENIWLMYLGNQYRTVRHFGDIDEDIFLFNYKGKIIELLLKVEKGTPPRMFNEIFGVKYIKIIEMNPKKLPNIDGSDLTKLICKALEAKEVGESFFKEYGKYAYEKVANRTECFFCKGEV